MLVSLGDAVLDVFVRPHGAILPGSDVDGTVRLFPGGSAANVAVWAARLGSASTFIGAVGDDTAGALLRADFAREGVTAQLSRLSAPTATIAVVVDSSGERAMIPDRGAAALLTAEMIEPAWIPAGCLLHLPAYGLFAEPTLGAALRAVALCREAGGRISVDTSSVGPLRRFGRERFLALLDQIAPDVLFANAEEGSLLSACSDAESGTLVLRRHVPLVIWKLGAGGAMARGEQVVRTPGLPVPALDSTGAGDAFAAAFLVALLRDECLASAVAQANALAALVVQHLGARPVLQL